MYVQLLVAKVLLNSWSKLPVNSCSKLTVNSGPTLTVNSGLKLTVKLNVWYLLFQRTMLIGLTQLWMDHGVGKDLVVI